MTVHQEGTKFSVNGLTNLSFISQLCTD